MNSSSLIAALALAFVPLNAPVAQEIPSSETEASEQTALEMRADQVIDMINGELEAEVTTVFTEQFLAAVPPAQLSQISTQFTASFGKAIAVESLKTPQGPQSAIRVRMERAIAVGVIVIDPAKGDRISGLRFTDFDPINDSAEKIEADLRALPGTVSAYFAPLMNNPIISIAPDEQLAIGSTFKLYVLAALANEISYGRRKWDDVVALDTKSFPSGMMQDWPKGAPVTLQTLASLMISISDNTATDQLIKLLGRDVIDKIMRNSGHSKPELNTPFLTTRELFELKGGDKDRLETYRKADPAVRAQILEGLGSEAVTTEQIDGAFANGPVALDVEWLANTGDLARLMTFILMVGDQQTLDIMSINENIADGARKGWTYVGYKGGSEPGVLNLTWLLADEEGLFHILTLGWNNPDAVLDESKLELIAQRILALPRE